MSREMRTTCCGIERHRTIEWANGEDCYEAQDGSLYISKELKRFDRTIVVKDSGTMKREYSIVGCHVEESVLRKLLVSTKSLVLKKP
jgi:hypothetical protein